MKLINLLIIIAVLFANSIVGQNSDLPGEDFDLEALAGVMEKVSNFEELEKAINDQSNDINNLDLDKNGEVDFVLIHEEADGNTHVAFLKVATSENAFQDVASIEMEKLSSSTASFQIVGEETLYGKDYILEPDDGVVDISGNSETAPSGGEGGPSTYFFIPPPAVHITIVVGCYSPGYKVYVSPYGFVVVPAWYRPWPPAARHSYRARSARWHRSAYRRTAHRRSHHAHSMHKKHHHYNAPKSTHYGSSPSNKSTQPSNNQNHNSQPNTSTQQKQTTTTQQKQSNTTQQKQGTTTQQNKSGGLKKGKR